MSYEERHSRGSHHSSERRHHRSKPYPSSSPERRPHSSDSPDKAHRRASPGSSRPRTPGGYRRPQRPSCAFCGGAHGNNSCQKYPSAEDRRQALRRYARCFRCFVGTHHSKKCPVRLGPCCHCKGLHNSALCNKHFPRRERNPKTPEYIVSDDDEPIGDAPPEAEDVSRSPPQPLRGAEDPPQPLRGADEAYFNVAPASPSSSESEPDLRIDASDDGDGHSPVHEAARPTVSTKSASWKKFRPPIDPCGIEEDSTAKSSENRVDPGSHSADRSASSSFEVADEWNSGNDKSTVSSPHVGGSSSRTPREPKTTRHVEDSGNQRERRTSVTVFSDKPPDEERNDLEKERLRLAQMKLKLEEDKLAIQGQQQALLDMETDTKQVEENLRAGNAELDKDKATLKAERKQLEDERKELKQALSDQQTTLATWSEELEAQQKRTDEREKELNQRQENIEVSEKELKEAQENLQADQTVLINDQSALRLKETKLEADLTELNNLAEVLNSAKEGHEQAQAKLAAERAELERERRECSGQEQSADQVDELAATKAELNDLKTLFNQQSTVLAEVHRRLSEQFDKRRQLRARLLQSEADGAQHKAEKEALQLTLEFREQLHRSHDDIEQAAEAAHQAAPNAAATASPSSSTTLGKRPHPTEGAQSDSSAKRSRQPWDAVAVEGLKVTLASLEAHVPKALLAKGIEFVSVNLLDGVAPLCELLDFLTDVDPTMSAFAGQARDLV